MPVIEDVEGLLDALGRRGGPLTLDALRAQGYTLSPELERRIAAIRARHRGPTPSRAGAAPFPIRYTVGLRPSAGQARSLAGGYDAIVAFRMDVPTQVLRGLWLNGVWWREVTLPPSTDLTMSVLRDLLEGVPEGDEVALGPVRFPEAPTVRAGTRWPLVRQAFFVDFVRPSTGQILTRLSGTAQIGVGIEQQVDPSPDLTVRLTVGPIPEPPNRLDEERLRIELDPDSPVRFRTDDGRLLIETALDSVLSTQIAADAPQLTFAPEIHLPVGGGFDFTVPPNIELRLEPIADVLILGLHWGAADASQLAFPGFSGDENVYAAVSEDLLRRAVQQAYASGALQRFVDESSPEEFAVSGAELDLKPGEIHLIISGRLVDYCKFDADLGVTATEIRKIRLDGDRICIAEDRNLNFDDADLTLCVILAGLEFLLPVWNLYALWRDLKWLSQFFVGTITTGETCLPYMSGVLQTNDPIPGTERIVRMTARRLQLDDGQLALWAAASFAADDIHVFLYASFLDGSGAPLRGVRVKLLDQDNPPPRGDDVVPPEDSVDRDTGSGEGPRTATASHYEPTPDQGIATAVTDEDGRAVFVVAPSRLRTAAGHVTTTTTVLERGPDRPPRGEPEVPIETSDTSTTVDIEPVPEPRPDLYFRVTLPTGRVVDTRALPSGLLLNFRERRLGSWLQPMIYRVGGGTRGPRRF